MSLIYDNPWLVSQLIKSALSEEERLSKKAQVDPNLQYAGDGLKAMLNNLRDQITPLKEGPTQVGYDTWADLKSPDMDSMGDFVQWLASHGTRFGGKVIVYPGNVEQPAEDYSFYRIEAGSIIEVPLSRSQRPTTGYWVNDAALKQFLTSLQSDQKLRNNVIFQVQLLKLIQMANKELDAAISEEYKAPEKEDSYPLDQVPKLLMYNDSKRGSEVLAYGDLKSTESFNGWLIKHQIAVMNEKNILSPDTQDQFIRSKSHCAALMILFYRANSHLQASVRPEDTERFKVMISQLQKLAPSYQCNLAGQQQQQQGQQTGQQGAGSNITVRALIGLAALQPFNTRNINFQEIDTFLTKYLEIKPQVAPLVGQVRNAMQLANGILKSPGAPLDVHNFNVAELKLKTEQPHQLLNYLYTIITVAGSIYSDFIAECTNVFKDMRGGDNLIRTINEQIDGPHRMNVGAITRVMSTLGPLPQGGR